MLPLRQHVCAQDPIVLFPRAFVFFCVSLDVVLREMLDRLGCLRLLFCGGWIVPFARTIQRIPRPVARRRERDHAGIAKGESPEFAAVAIQHAPRLRPVLGDAQREARCRCIEVFRPFASDRLESFDRANVNLIVMIVPSAKDRWTTDTENERELNSPDESDSGGNEQQSLCEGPRARQHQDHRPSYCRSQ